MSTLSEAITMQALAAKDAAPKTAALTAEKKKHVLESIADALDAAAKEIVFHNEIDVEAAREAGIAEAMIDRLTLTLDRVTAMARGVREIAGQPDPIGEVIEKWTRPNGMVIEKIRAPLGVIGMIYESRPNVTVDAAALCLKAGNAVLLRGGSEALNSNRMLAQIMSQAVAKEGLPAAAISLLGDSSREAIVELSRLDGIVDLIIARGSEQMIRHIMQQATVPVLGHGKGVCHVYVDDKADLVMAEKIAFNAKVQRPGVCNAMETLLVHESVAAAFLPQIGRAYGKAGVEIRGDEVVQKAIPDSVPATADDWGTEYSDLIVSIRVVPSLDEAITHINQFGSGHSDAIITADAAHAESFVTRVDSAAVFHNASTRLHDGSVFGLGAEIGISTRKLHARGTMGARELTTTKYVVRGSGQIRE